MKKKWESPAKHEDRCCSQDIFVCLFYMRWTAIKSTMDRVLLDYVCEFGCCL